MQNRITYFFVKKILVAYVICVLFILLSFRPNIAIMIEFIKKQNSLQCTKRDFESVNLVHVKGHVVGRSYGEKEEGCSGEVDGEKGCTFDNFLQYLNHR